MLKIMHYKRLAVFPRQSLKSLINVDVNIMEFIKKFLSKFPPSKFYAILYKVSKKNANKIIFVQVPYRSYPKPKSITMQYTI